jgi:ribosomal protein L11 methyltransferase
VLTALFRAGSQGVHEDGDDLVTHFQPEADVQLIQQIILAADPDAAIAVTDTPAVDWGKWLATVGAHTVGRLTVAPPWLAAQYDQSTTIVIDPAMAFGTGEHATTRGVLRLMQTVIRSGDTVADLGAGSAVLAIAAAKLGAARVAAIELDPDASANAQENIQRNGVEPCVNFIEGDAAMLLALLAPVRVVLANIVSSVLLDLLPEIAAALGADGQAILSGILQEEREMMLAQLTKGGWKIEEEDTEDQWWSVLIARPS